MYVCRGIGRAGGRERDSLNVCKRKAKTLIKTRGGASICKDPGNGGSGEDAVQIIREDGDQKTYISYGNSEYEGLWWAPDGRKYVMSFRQNGENRVVLNWLDTHNEWNLNPILNMGGEGAQYQFLQWGKDGDSMLFYYSTEDQEGYFWYNCETGQVSGILELTPEG